MAKKKQQKTDTVITQVNEIKIYKTRYRVIVTVIADGKDGYPKADCPIEIYVDSKKKATKNTDSEGHVDFEVNVPYASHKKNFFLMAKVQGSTARELKTVPFPTPADLTLKIGKIKDEGNYFRVPVEAVVHDSEGRPRPRTEVALSCKEEKIVKVTDKNGSASHDFYLPLEETGEERQVTGEVGGATREISFALPPDIILRRWLARLREWVCKKLEGRRI